jgi:Ca2+-binding EF-hand superfamily protein
MSNFYLSRMSRNQQRAKVTLANIYTLSNLKTHGEATRLCEKIFPCIDRDGNGHIGINELKEFKNYLMTLVNY